MVLQFDDRVPLAQYTEDHWLAKVLLRSTVDNASRRVSNRGGRSDVHYRIRVRRSGQPTGGAARVMEADGDESMSDDSELEGRR